MRSIVETKPNGSSLAGLRSSIEGFREWDESLLRLHYGMLQAA